MEYTIAFEKAVNHAMLYEVGGFWKLTQEVEAGLINTPEQRKACGYVNDPLDRGGETKFGVAKNANPDLDITALTWEEAKLVYYKRYWMQAHCNELPARLAVLHFDGAVNSGVGRAAKFLQRAVGAVADGAIGPATIALVQQKDEIEMCHEICDFRARFYEEIVANDHTQTKYLKGWLRRIQEMRDFTTSIHNDFE